MSRETRRKPACGEFFDKFEEKRLVFLYQEQTQDGGTSRFFKLVNR